MGNERDQEKLEKLDRAFRNSVCFDAEPLLAYYWDTEGSDIVEDYFADILQGERIGYVSDITYCEMRYHVLRKESGHFYHFHKFLADTIELEAVSSNKTWHIASNVKKEYPIALGDAFSIATAIQANSTLIVGADDDFEPITEVDIEQIQTTPD